MEIIVADKTKLIEVLYVIRECSQQLIEKGVKYWNNSVADYHEISNDIANQNVFLLVVNKVTIGTVTIKPNKQNASKYDISRLAIFPHFQKRGYASEILKFAENYSKDNGAKVLVGTTPIDDEGLSQLLQENGFVNQGVDGEVHEEFIRIKFEKQLN